MNPPVMSTTALTTQTHTPSRRLGTTQRLADTSATHPSTISTSVASANSEFPYDEIEPKSSPANPRWLRHHTSRRYTRDVQWLDHRKQLIAAIPNTAPSNTNVIANAIERTQQRLQRLSSSETLEYQTLTTDLANQQQTLSLLNKRWHKKAYQQITKNIEQLQSKIADSAQKPAVITHLRLQHRIKQLEKLQQWSAQKSVEVIGFDGWGKDCYFHNTDHNTSAHSNLGEYDALIYRENGVIQIKRLNATIELQTTQSIPQHFHIESHKSAQQQSYIDAKAKRTALNDGRFWLTTHGWQKQKTWIGRLGASAGGFAFDGPDDCASFAKESVEGIAQPLIHLGVLGGFYPFVALGASGLADELHETRDNIEAITAKHQQTNADINANLEMLGIRADQDLKTVFAALVNSTQVNHTQADSTYNPDTSSTVDAWETCSLLIQRAVLEDQLKWAKADNKEIWCAKHGMQGMLQAMRLFMLEAGSTLTSLLTSGNAMSASAMTAFLLGNIGSAVMGGGQVLMMTAGAIKTTHGLRQWRQLRQQARALETLNSRNENLKKVAFHIAQHKRLQAKWAALTQTLPGSSLTIGQALMATWSGLSLAALASGVGAPAFPLMLSLLVPGVGLTLAAVGLEKTHEHYQDNDLAQHGPEDNFDAPEYLRTLFHQQANHASSLASSPSSAHTLASWQTTLTNEYNDLSTRLATVQNLQTCMPPKTSRWLPFKQIRAVAPAETPTNFERLQSIGEILASPFVAPTANDKTSPYHQVLEKMHVLDCMDAFVENLYQQRRHLIRADKSLEKPNHTADIFDQQQTQKKRRFGGYAIKRYYALNPSQLLSKLDADTKLERDFYEAAKKTLTAFATLRLRAMQDAVGSTLATSLLAFA